jgi:hypothetical protein
MYLISPCSPVWETNRAIYANDTRVLLQFIPVACTVAAFFLAFGIKWNKIPDREKPRTETRITDTPAGEPIGGERGIKLSSRDGQNSD